MAEEVQFLTVIGLGNPGKKYALTRHNLGFIVVEELARQLQLSFQPDRRLKSLMARGKVNEREIDLLLPQTFMNESGQAVRHYLDYYKRTASQILVVCDDTALDFGQLRLRKQGSSGGHNGLKNIVMHLGTHEFARLKMGIGSKGIGQPLAEYVLSDFTREESVLLEDFARRGADALKSLMTEPLSQVLNRVNTKLTL